MVATNFALLAAAATTLLAPVVSADSWTGCGSAMIGLPMIFGRYNSLGDCAARCKRDLIPYSTASYKDGSCWCALTSPDQSWWERLGSNGGGTPGNCPRGSWEYANTKSNYVWQACPAVISGTPVRTGTTLFFELGSNACASVGAKWMTVKYHSFKINYACFTQQPRVARPQNCIKDAVYLYSTGATVSGLRRRLELEAREEAAQLALQKMRCPAGLTACHVSNNPEHGFECLDTTVELESCGGCLYGEFGANSTLSVGTDCSSLPDVRAATCVQGECAVTACRDGRKPINGVC